MNNKRTKYVIIALIGIAIWLGENIYFGWNAKPESGAEAGLDLLSQGLFFWGVIGDLFTNVKIVKHYHNITNTKKLTYLDQRPKGKVGLNFGGKKNGSI